MGAISKSSAALALALALAIAGTAAADEPKPEEPKPDAVMAEMGAAPFARYCAACHGESARGDGPVASSLSTPPADLTRIAARRNGEFPRGDIGRVIDGRFIVDAHGSREMPVWGTRFGDAIADPGLSEEISRGTIAVLLEYLASIQAD